MRNLITLLTLIATLFIGCEKESMENMEPQQAKQPDTIDKTQLCHFDSAHNVDGTHYEPVRSDSFKLTYHIRSNKPINGCYMKPINGQFEKFQITQQNSLDVSFKTNKAIDFVIQGRSMQPDTKIKAYAVINGTDTIRKHINRTSKSTIFKVIAPKHTLTR